MIQLNNIIELFFFISLLFSASNIFYLTNNRLRMETSPFKYQPNLDALFKGTGNHLRAQVDMKLHYSYLYM
ncbi:hypothetical protein HUJ04_004607 [Dendroctonus ponderosae]|nr:hypothetical protein HUJ04_004607 [Dendroctonus ponderosae]